MSQGEASPLARLYDLDAWVLLLGVGYQRNTCFHLAEYRCRFAAHEACRRGAPILRNEGARQASPPPACTPCGIASTTRCSG
jgi:aminoglycoside 3-N-acetyltransferase